MQKNFNQVVDELVKAIDQQAADVNARFEKLLEAQYGPLSKAMKTGDRRELRKALTPAPEPELSPAQRAAVYAAALAVQKEVPRSLEDLVEMVKAELWVGLAKSTTLGRGFGDWSIQKGVTFEGAVREAASRVRMRLRPVFIRRG